jgi:hypothetical protein
MRGWIRMMTSAIRAHDGRHLITVGFLPFGGYARFAGDLDFLSVHVYPETGQVDAAVELLGQLQAGKPVLVEETFLLNIGAEGMRDFLDRSRGLAAGWIGFYWGDTPADLTPPATVSEALMKDWLDLFVELAPAGPDG